MRGGPGGKTFLERCCLGSDAHEVKESAVYHVVFWGRVSGRGKSKFWVL